MYIPSLFISTNTVELNFYKYQDWPLNFLGWFSSPDSAILARSQTKAEKNAAFKGTIIWCKAVRIVACRGRQGVKGKVSESSQREVCYTLSREN